MYYSSEKPRYSPLGPIDILEKLQDKELLGNYLLLLAPEILRDPRRYIDLIDEIRATDHDDGIFTIVDNGLIEQSKPISTAQVIEAATYIDADCIQMPDVLGERMPTQRAVMESAGLLRECGFPLMKIPQGDDSGEQVKCVEWLRDYIIPGKVDYWGIPRWIANTAGSRIPIIQYINASTENPRIHLLGMSNRVDDDLRCCLLPNVMGIDSANPLVMAHRYNRDLSSMPGAYVHAERGNYMQSTKLSDTMIRNVEYMHGLVSGFPSQAD